MTVDTRWWVVSDLHLGAPRPDPREPARAFAGFLTREVLPRADGSHVLLLGDWFELVGLDNQQSLDRLDQIAADHSEVFDALADCVRSGVRVHFVCGNHDVELARPAVARRLVMMLSPCDADGVTVHPWAFHVPGVLYAEHGHQHHALHRLPTLLQAAVNGTDDLEPPPLAVWGGRASGVLGQVPAVSRSLLASRRAERRARTPAYDALLRAESARMGMRPGAVRELSQVSSFRTVPAVTGTAARLVVRRLRPNEPAPAAPAAAGRVARALAAHAATVGWYLSGHTHRAADVPIGGSPTRYVNTGTWTSDVRGRGPDRDDPRLFPYAVIEVGEHGAAAGGLRYWRQPNG